jgi:DnaJ-class molecular chaperone
LTDLIEGESPIAEVCMTDGYDEKVRFDWITFPPGATVGQVPCHECGGTGWWGFGPIPSTCGPCVDCKGTGREWVGLA